MIYQNTNTLNQNKTSPDCESAPQLRSTKKKNFIAEVDIGQLWNISPKKRKTPSPMAITVHQTESPLRETVHILNFNLCEICHLKIFTKFPRVIKDVKFSEGFRNVTILDYYSLQKIAARLRSWGELSVKNDFTFTVLKYKMRAVLLMRRRDFSQ